LFVPFWQALIIALVPSAAAIATAVVAVSDLGMRRRLETSKQFLLLFAAAHGRPVDRADIGVGEQVATIHLIADFAAKEKLLKNAASAGLRDLTSWAGAGTSGSTKVAEAAKAALKRLEDS
jgi:hypothetical protein